MKKPSTSSWKLVAALAVLVAGAGYLAWPSRETSDDVATTKEHASHTRDDADHTSNDRAGTSDDAPTASLGEVAVRVLSQGKPVAGARVQLVPLDAAHGALGPACNCAATQDAGPDDDPDDATAALDAECMSCPEALDSLFDAAERGVGFLASAEQQTGSDGVARFQVKSDDTVAVWVQADGLRPATIEPSVVEPHGDPEDVELEPSNAARIRVEDGDGNPVSNAQLAVFCSSPFWPLTKVLSGPSQALANPPTGADVVVVARAPGYVPVQEPLASDGETTVLVLQHPRTMRGRALHGDEPVAKATIQLSGESVEASRTVQSDADGRFAIDGLAPGSYQLTGDRDRLHGELELQLDDSDDGDEVALAMAETSHLRGHVVDAASGKPIADADVQLRGDGDQFGSDSTNPTGGFDVAIEPGSYVLTITDRGHLPYTAPVTLAEGESRELEVRLQSGISVAGQVVDAEGRPVAEAHVSIERADFGDDVVRDHTDTTDGSGHFTISGLVEGQHVLTVEATGHPDLEQPLRVPSDALTLHLGDGASLVGLVLGPDGPLKDARVAVSGDHGVNGSTRTDAAGHFEFPGLQPGAALVVATASGLAASEPVPLELHEGAHAQVELHLEAGLSLTGRVEDDQGQPIGDALVEAYAEHGPRSPMPGRNVSATSRDDGTFTLTGLRDGQYKMFAYHDGLSADAPVTASPGDAQVVLKLLRAGKVSGRVVSRSGGPVKRFMVEGQEFHNVDGSFLLKDVGGDAAEIVVEGPFPSVTVQVSVKPGETTDVGTITVDDGEPLRGVVLTADGQPAPGVEVTALPPGYTSDGSDDDDSSDSSVLDSPRTLLTDSDGRFHFDHLRRGSYLLQAKSATATSPPRRTQTGTDVELVLQPGASLHGTASMPDGSPLRDGAAVFVSGAVTAQARVVGGQFELRGLPSGPGQLILSGASAQNRASTVLAISLSPGESREVQATVQLSSPVRSTP